MPDPWVRIPAASGHDSGPSGRRSGVTRSPIGLVFSISGESCCASSVPKSGARARPLDSSRNRGGLRAHAGPFSDDSDDGGQFFCRRDAPLRAVCASRPRPPAIGPHRSGPPRPSSTLTRRHRSPQAPFRLQLKQYLFNITSVSRSSRAWQLRLTREDDKTVDRLAAKHGASKNDVIRKALRLLAKIEKLNDDGDRLIVERRGRSDDREAVEVWVL